eukprot:1226067-Alexandrium_andersonii.AAC.1
MASDAAAAGPGAVATARGREVPAPERTRSTAMPALLAKAPPPHIFPGLGQLDAAHAARAWSSIGGVAYRVVSPPSAPTSGSTVSSGDRRGGAPAGPAPPSPALGLA